VASITVATWETRRPDMTAWQYSPVTIVQRNASTTMPGVPGKASSRANQGILGWEQEDGHGMDEFRKVKSGTDR